MPTYDYTCAECGAFEALRPIAERDRPADCPRCGRGAQRMWGGGAHLQRVDAGTRRLIAAQERAASVGAYARMRHPAACGCCRR